MKHLALLVPLLLTACESEEERKLAYMNFCTTHEFSQAQCEVLYLNKRSSDNAESAANSASAMSGFAVGMSAGSTGRR